ncbi:hypothetical protein [Spiroplasma endosymbiont of Poecilobothrus nobilitatus]|uniref:hypothetical protein n=1 Tax=Spiroplasma endosymbiont of Poecilobothrus nobilitatus TaxID=1209220 RepID=UPI00313C7796
MVLIIVAHPHLNINKKHTYVPLGTGDYIAYAKEYDNLIAKAGGINLQLLGLGTNGHVGFNEPPADFNSLTGVMDLVPSTIEVNCSFFCFTRWYSPPSSVNRH